VRTSKVAALFAAAVLVAAACSGSGEDGADATPLATTTVASANSTVATTTTTAAPPTTTPVTTTTLPPTPEEARAAFLDSLEIEGWVSYLDPTGWSIMYPSDWMVFAEEPPFFLVTPSEILGAVSVTTALDAAASDLGSSDYLLGGVDFAVDDGLLTDSDPEGVFWLDINLDGFEGLRDVFGIELSFVRDPTTGEPVPEDANAPTWWYGYYDPALRPNVAYTFQTFGVDPLLFAFIDTIVATFTPAAGFPGDEAPVCDVFNSMAAHLAEYLVAFDLVLAGDLEAGFKALEPVAAAFEDDLALLGTIPGVPSDLEPLASVMPVILGNYAIGTNLIAEGAREGDFDKIQEGEQIHIEGSAALGGIGAAIDIAATC